VENGLGLTTITGLLTVVTSLTLSEKRSLTSLVLGDLVRSVLSTLGTLAVGVTGLGNVDLLSKEFNMHIHVQDEEKECISWELIKKKVPLKTLLNCFC
jgi:hypothetical protein